MVKDKAAMGASCVVCVSVSRGFDQRRDLDLGLKFSVAHGNNMRHKIVYIFDACSPCATEMLLSVAHVSTCATETSISVAHGTGCATECGFLWHIKHAPEKYAFGFRRM